MNPAELMADEVLARRIRSWRSRSLVVGLAGSAAAGVGLLVGLVDRHAFFPAYLTAFLLWTGLAAGSLAVLLLHHLVGGWWGYLTRRILETAAGMLPFSVVLFVPIALGLHDLYHWSHAEVVAKDPILQKKSGYLNEPFFLARTGACFVLWTLIVWLVNRWSHAQDRDPGDRVTNRLRVVAGPAIVLHVLIVTFSSIDWGMSLEPHWFSAIYGVLFLVGQALSALAFAVLVLVGCRTQKPFIGVIATSHFHDLGKLLFAFVMLWAYMSLSQFLIIWSGNLPEEVPFYVHRSTGGWEWVALLIIALQFFFPFLALLSADLKRKPGVLAFVAVMILLLRWVDLSWYVQPAFHPGHLHLDWVAVAAPLGVGGVWLALFFTMLLRKPLLPVHTPAAGHAQHTVEPGAAPAAGASGGGR
jgi:hypothetical protein